MKNDYMVIIYQPNVKTVTYKYGVPRSLEEARQFCMERHNMQVTFEDVQQLPEKDYSHIIEFRDGEHYNDLYYIEQKFARSEHEPEDPEEKHWRNVATYNERHAPSNDPDYYEEDY